MVLHARRPEISFLDPWSRKLHARPRLAMILRLLLNLNLFYHTVRRFNHSKNALYFYTTQNPETARNLLPLSLTVLAVFLFDQLGARKYSHAFTDQNDKHVITILSTWKWKDNITLGGQCYCAAGDEMIDSCQVEVAKAYRSLFLYFVSVNNHQCRIRWKQKYGQGNKSLYLESDQNLSTQTVLKLKQHRFIAVFPREFRKS